MVTKIVSLKSTEDVICGLEPIRVEGQVVGYELYEPRLVSFSEVRTLAEQVDPTAVSVNFRKWQLFSEDTRYQIPADWVVTICEPLPQLKLSYEEKLEEHERTMSALSE